MGSAKLQHSQKGVFLLCHFNTGILQKLILTIEKQKYN